MRLNHKKDWTEKDIRTLVINWNEVSRPILAKKLGRTWKAIIWKADELKLPFGIPSGCESIDKASKRCKMSRKTFLIVLRRYEVQIRRLYGRKYANGYKLYADSYEIDEAVSRHNTLLPLTKYAYSKSINPGTLVRLMLENGIPYETTTGEKRTGRGRRLVNPTLLDPIIDAYRRTNIGRLGLLISRGKRAA